MAKVIHFDKGSKRRLRLIRWTSLETTSAALLFALLVSLCVAAALWEAAHTQNPYGRAPLQIRR
jgi:hypothetical protein